MRHTARTTISIDPQNFVILAHVSLACAALKAGPTREVRFGSDILTNLDEGYVAPHLHHVAAQFMADNPRRMDPPLSPFVPAVNMDVRSTQRGGSYFHNSIMGTWRGVGPRGEG